MEVDEVTYINARKRKREDENKKLLGIVYDETLRMICDQHPRIPGRSFAVFSLLQAYNLFEHFTVIKPKTANFEELCNFHSSCYIEYLQEINNSYTPDDDVELDYGIGYDCPPLDGIYDFCCAIGGSSLVAARALLNGSVDIAVNWFGGWHHAQRDEAEGFCYVNDICLAILELRKSFENVLYFDLDTHHGNGVENAFSYSKRVMTVSIHLFEPGFYPGTGLESDIGFGNGTYYAVNVPLQSGASDKTYIALFDWLLPTVLAKFTPDAVVVQCGADGLSGDPVGKSFNLSEKAFGHCLKQLLDLNKPTLVLGGGGYHVANTARCWTYLTSVITGAPINTDIPEHKNFQIYSPSFEVNVSTSLRKDNNSPEYLRKLKANIERNLEKIGDL